MDKRVNDGFMVSFAANKMCIHYQSDIKLKDIYGGGFENEMNRMINEIKKFLQKEYKVINFHKHVFYQQNHMGFLKKHHILFQNNCLHLRLLSNQQRFLNSHHEQLVKLLDIKIV